MTFRQHLSITLLALGSAAPLLSWAADEPSEQTATLGEVIVTAQKRPENLQTVPVSVQVVSSQQLAELNNNSLNDLGNVLPGVHVGQGGSSNDLYIRGIGSDEGFPNQSVGTFVDDIYHGRSRTSSGTFLDLDHIEILKGPQTTYFGDNSIAGALNVITAKPGKRFDAWARVLYGEWGQYAVEGAAGGPITGAFGVRLAATANGDGGWNKNEITGKYTPRDNNQAARVTLALQPNDDLSATLKIEGNKTRNSGAYPRSWVNCPPPAPIPMDYGTFPGAGCSDALRLGIPIGLQYNVNFESPGQGYHLSSLEDVLTVHYRRWGQTFTSVTGFYNFHWNFNFDLGGVPGFLFTLQQPEKYHQFSQEFRLVSPQDRAIDYVAGLYFRTDHDDGVTSTDVPALNPLLAGSPFTPYLPLGEYDGASQGERVYSVFGALGWNLTRQLKLSGGLRGSWIEQDLTGNNFYGTATQPYGGVIPTLPAPLNSIPLFGTPVVTATVGRSDHAWMPSAKVEYRVEPDVMAYFSYTRGFKQGGINPPSSAGIASYKPEYVNAYEAGIKSQWLNDRFLLNLDVFRSDYRDLQIISTIILGNGQQQQQGINAASSRAQGVELETKGIITESFRLAANVTYLDSRYIRFPGASASAFQAVTGQATQDLSGAPTQFAPEWSGSITADYWIRLPRGLELLAEGVPYYSSSYYIHDSDEPFFRQLSYLRVDARLSLQSPGGPWAIDVIGKNLTDREIMEGVTGYYGVWKAPRRSWAVQARYHW